VSGPDQSADPGSRLAGGRLLARNTGFSLAGQAATLLSAFIAVPLLVAGLGTARFGVLALAWVVIGYAQVFDLGIGRALTKLTSEAIGERRDHDVSSYFWTALLGMAVLGVLVGAIVAALTPWLVDTVLNIPDALERETRTAFLLLAISLPLAISGAALRAHLEAWQRFDLVNAVVVPAAVITYLGPVLALQIENSLPLVVAAVILSRVFSWSVNCFNCLRITGRLRSDRRPSRRSLRQLLGVGGWVTAANVTNALMQASDRFLIGILGTLTAVAYFATPYEVVTKLWLVSFAVAGVFFPAFALTLRTDPGRTTTIFGGAMRFAFIALFPVVLVIVAFAKEGLDLWLGPAFAANSEVVLQWLAAGALVASLAQIPFGLVQSARPDLTGKLALVELPIYLAVFIALFQGFGLEGAAAAWALRAVVEIAVLLVLAQRVAPGSVSALARLAWMAVAGGAGMAVASQLTGTEAKIVFVAIALAAFAPLAWRFLLGSGERDRVRARLAAGRGAA
jgi:O-antigen/teichoic acid export membrane protein